MKESLKAATKAGKEMLQCNVSNDAKKAYKEIVAAGLIMFAAKEATNPELVTN